MDSDAPRYRTLYELARVPGAEVRAGRGFAAMAGSVRAALGAEAAGIALLDPDTRGLELVGWDGEPGWQPPAQRLGEGTAGWAALHGRPLLVPDLTGDGRALYAPAGAWCELAAPLFEDGHPTGVVWACAARPKAFTAAAAADLEAYAAEIARTAHRGWTDAHLRERARQLDELVDSARELAAQRQAGDLYGRLARAATALLGADLGLLFLPAEKGLRVAAATAGGEPAVGQTLDPEESVLGTALRRQRVVEVAELLRGGEEHAARWLPGAGLRSLLAVPVAFEGEPLAVLALYSRRLRRRSDDERKLALAVAGLGAVALQNTRLYERIFASEETLRRNERLTTLGLLAAEIAHEVRNPLTVIKLLFEGLDLHYPPGDLRRDDVRVITEKLGQLEATVTRVLQFGKGGGGLHSRWPLATVARETLHLVRLKLEQLRIRLDFHAPATPLIVEGNRGQLQQVLLNLMLNATNVMPGGGTIGVRLGSVRREGQPWAVLDLSDTGPGIAEDLRADVFDSFLSGKADGTGLGLGIVKRILTAHRGRIEVLSTGPEGTTFRLWLPCAE